MTRLTRRHRGRRRAYLFFAVLTLACCIGMLLGEMWVYSRDPQILSRTFRQAWVWMTGMEGLQEESDGLTEDLLPDMPGTENVLSNEGDFSQWDDDFDWAAWEQENGWDMEDGDLFWDDSWDLNSEGLDWGDDFFLDEDGNGFPGDGVQDPDNIDWGDGLEWDLFIEDNDDLIWEDAPEGAEIETLPEQEAFGAPEGPLRIGAGEKIVSPKE